MKTFNDTDWNTLNIKPHVCKIDKDYPQAKAIPLSDEEPIECTNCGKQCGDDMVVFKGLPFCCGECCVKCEGVK